MPFLTWQSQVIDSLETGEHPCCIFLDLVKAFDTVNKGILIGKLNHYGIRGKFLNWLTSYLTDRKQQVQIGNTLSDPSPIADGVPQGSILGPLLFLLYINDIAQSSKILKFTMFADDTCIFLSCSKISDLEIKLNTEIVHVSNWLKANKLSLNVDKTKVMLFRHKHKSNDIQLKVTMEGELLESVKVTKYLGLQIDHKLLFNHHTDSVAEKIKKGNCLLAKVRHYVPHKDLKSFYYAHIQSHLEYGSLIWGTGSTAGIDKLTKLQDRSLKLIEFIKAAGDAANAYRQNGILSLTNSIFYKNVNFIWSVVNMSITSRNIIDIFTNDLITRDTGNNKFVQPHRRTDAGKQFITCQGVKHWNSLHRNLTTLTNKLVFQKELKSLLLA